MSIGEPLERPAAADELEGDLAPSRPVVQRGGQEVDVARVPVGHPVDDLDFRAKILAVTTGGAVEKEPESRGLTRYRRRCADRILGCERQREEQANEKVPAVEATAHHLISICMKFRAGPPRAHPRMGVV